jgi:hypothetical protein
MTTSPMSAAGALAQGDVGQDLGGAADDRRVGVDRGVAGEQPDLLGAEDVAQREELLVDQRLDRRGVEADPVRRQGREVGGRRDEGLARAGRGREETSRIAHTSATGAEVCDRSRTSSSRYCSSSTPPTRSRPPLAQTAKGGGGPGSSIRRYCSTVREVTGSRVPDRASSSRIAWLRAVTKEISRPSRRSTHTLPVLRAPCSSVKNRPEKIRVRSRSEASTTVTGRPAFRRSRLRPG